MTQKERLIELLKKAPIDKCIDISWDEHFSRVANYFLDNGVIVDAKPTIQNWNTIRKRPMDEEERKYYSERYGYDIEYEEAVIYSNIPVDGQEVLVLGKNGKMWVDEFSDDPYDGCYFEEWGEMDGIVAWMELPKPPKEEDNEQRT